MPVKSNHTPIEIRNLTKTFGAVRALAGLELTVREGEVHGFLGPNGAGKTSTVEILEGFRSRSGGDVRVLGLDPEEVVAEFNGQASAPPAPVMAPAPLAQLPPQDLVLTQPAPPAGQCLASGEDGTVGQRRLS